MAFTGELTRKWANGLTMEYTRKIDCFIENLPKRMCKPLQQVGFCGFVTKDRLSLEDAYAHQKAPFTVGQKWGKKWEYGWFFSEITIPEEAEGQRVVFQANLGEGLVFINGKVYGALDKEHHMITLSMAAKAGEAYQIAMEVYAGHGEATDHAIIIPEENTQSVQIDIAQNTVQSGSISIFHDEVFQLWMDLNTLYDLRKQLPEISWRRTNIDKGLKQICDAVDIEAPFLTFMEGVKKARKAAAPVLACKNGTSAPTMYAIGNSHLDLEWNWTVDETRRKAARTIGNQLRLLEEYDDYIYLQSQPWLLETVKNEYPDLYAEVKEWVKKGRFIPEGGMWVQSDTNLPSGESLIRQFVVGKKFISQEFGIDSEIFWLPDSFGTSPALPQIMAGCGVKYFMSAKLPWLYNGGDMFPCHNFIWKGADGTQVQAHIINGYNPMSSPSAIYNRWEPYVDKEEIPDRLFLYGHGDGGGGATRIHMEYLKREKDLEGLPKVVSASPNEYFSHINNSYGVEKTYVGELYFAAHRGTYTSQAKTKKLNRRSEFALRDAELWTALIGKECKAETDALWKQVLFNQFHDILPGSAITQVHDRAEQSYADVIGKASKLVNDVLEDTLEAVSEKLTVFNSLSWDRNVIAQLPEGYHTAYDQNGVAVPTQFAEGKTLALLEVPACGMQTYTLGQAKPTCNTLVGKELCLENDLIKAVFNEYGELLSIVDKETGMEYLSAPSNRFRMYQDMPPYSDAWDIESFYEKVEVAIMPEASVSEVYTGPLVSGFTVRKKLNNSEITQKITLRKGNKRIDFETEVDWKETHKLLKVDFNTNIHTEEMISEIQFGYIKRPNHKSRQYDADRFEVCQQKWSALTESNRGVAVLNDCKYGISSDAGRMSLTLLKSAMAPAADADKGVHHFTYSVMPFGEALFESNVVREAYELNSPAIVKIGSAPTQSLLRVCRKNVIVDTVKYAEDGSGDLIIRMYEAMGSYSHCELEFGFAVKEAYVTDMLENNLEHISVCDNAVSLPFKAFEVVTLRVIL